MAKRRSFEHERELRAVIVLPIKEYDYNVGCPENHPLGVNVSIDLRKLICKLYVYPGSSGWVVEVVRSVVEQFGYGDIAVVPSTLLDRPRAARS